MTIHPMAVVHPNARIGEGTNIGPFAVIGEHVTIGAGCAIGPHVVIDGHTEIGDHCQFSPGASIGSPPQDIKYNGEPTRLVIGSHNVFREYVTVNCGTAGGGGVTTMGDHCLMLAYSHVAHDCHLGNQVILVNCASLAGHVTIEDFAIVEGLCGIHQFVRIGAHAFIGGCSAVAQDVPPYMMAVGDRAQIYGLNSVGLKRRNFSEESLKALEKACRLLFRSKSSLKNALEKVKTEIQGCAEVDYLVNFIERSERGVCSGVKRE